MTAAQEPRAGEVLTAESVKLLRAGDVLRLDGRDVRFRNLFMGGVRADDGSDKRISALPPRRFTFVSRPSESSASVGGEGEQKLLLKLIDTLKPLAEVAEKLSHCHVVEICESHPDNPSPNIVPMPREWFERAADDLESVVMILHRDAVLSEGQASKLTGLDRVAVRKQVDALRTQAPAREGEVDRLRSALWAMVEHFERVDGDVEHKAVIRQATAALSRQHQEGEGR